MTSTSMHTSVKGARRTSTSKAQQGDPNSPLDAVQRLRELLTEEVIPRLAGDRKAEEALPAGVAQALQDCYRTQSAEQADALAALFGALEEQHEASAEPQAAALAGTRAPAARAINIRPGVRVGPTGNCCTRSSRDTRRRARSTSPAPIARRRRAATTAVSAIGAVRQPRSTSAPAESARPDRAACATSRNGSTTSSPPTPSS